MRPHTSFLRSPARLLPKRLRLPAAPLIALLLALLPAALAAQCAGQDIRPQLSADARAEIAASAAAEPYGTGNFWRATRGDRSLTLIGTVHVDDPRLDPIAARFEAAVAGAEVVFLEMTEADQQALQRRLTEDPGLIVLPEGSLIELLPEQTWQTLAEAAAARGLPAPMAARLQPWYLSLVLALPPCALETGQTPRGLDARIAEQAAAAAVPTRALEPYDTLFSLFAEEPLEVQIDMLAASVMDDERAEDMLATTLTLYFEEEHAALWHLSRIAARSQLSLPVAEVETIFADLEETLLTARNRAWLEVLEAAPEREIVAAFGAAHLFGEAGVLQLLENAGYSLTRLAP
jgi:uncharacterized protein YbaP (TraB family)